VTVDSNPALFGLSGLLWLAVIAVWALAWWLTGRRPSPDHDRPRLRRVVRVILVAVAIVVVATLLYEVFVPTTCGPSPCGSF
jgi:thiol:disulfide interchange protein